MNRLLVLLFIVVFGSGSYSWSRATCGEYFTSPLTVDLVLNDLKQNLVRHLKKYGEPDDRPFLRLDANRRLRYFKLPNFKNIKQDNHKSVLRIEELQDEGLKTKALADVYLSTLGPVNAEIRVIPGSHFVRVFRWVSVEVPTDRKTGLIDANLESGRYIFNQVIEKAQQDKGTNYAILYVDINHLNFINSTRRAHTAGNELIQEAIGMVKQNLRMEKDRDTHDIGFKVGGDEYVFILKGVNPASLPQIANRLESKVRGNHKLIFLFNEGLSDFTAFLRQLTEVNSYADLSGSPEVLDFIHKTDLWTTKSVSLRRKVMEDPRYFKAFIYEYVRSSEVRLRFEKFRAVVPGVAVGYSNITSDKSAETLLTDADFHMTTRKNRQRASDYRNLPQGVVILKDIFMPPSFGNPVIKPFRSRD